MEKSAENYKAEYKNITIKTTDGSTIYGKINIGEKECRFRPKPATHSGSNLPLIPA